MDLIPQAAINNWLVLARVVVPLVGGDPDVQGTLKQPVDVSLVDELTGAMFAVPGRPGLGGDAASAKIAQERRHRRKRGKSREHFPDDCGLLWDWDQFVTGSAGVPSSLL